MSPQGSVSDAQIGGRPVVASSLEKSNELQESLLRSLQKSSNSLPGELAIWFDFICIGHYYTE